MSLAGAGDLLERLAAEVLARNLCDERGLARARRFAAEEGERLDATLVRLGLVSERGLAEAMAGLLALPLAARYPEVPVLPEQLRPAFLREARALPLAADAASLTLALADPLDPFAPAAAAAATGRAVRVAVAVPAELEAATARLYPPSEPETAPAESGPAEEDAERLRDRAAEAPVIRLVNQILSRAVESGASDVHLEPTAHGLRLRHRRDGVLEDAEAPPAALAPAILSRLKIMARLDIAERRLPQDGRIRLVVRGREIDFRLATLPALHGECAVLRVLDRDAIAFDLEALGLSPAVVAGLGTALAQPNGIVLVTGPTGSGKTTTLYSALAGLDAAARKILTLEDPIEYQREAIVQIQIRPQIGLGFAPLLRALLRQDPDVILVGEIRDLETAEVAAQAALTGHLVLSTLHTNTAAASLTRLRDMGLADYLLAAVLRGVLAQRLIRRLCPACRAPEPDPAALLAAFAPDHPPLPGARLWRPCGCPACRGAGYRGRLAIAEFLAPDAALSHAILTGAAESAIAAAARAAGMVPLREAGIAAALAGETTLAEVGRSLRAEG